MTRFEQLKKDLLQNFKDFQDIKHPGGSDEANESVADGLARSIAESIENGINIEFQGESYCANINAATKQPGYMYTAIDAGILDGEEPLQVQANTVVLWDGAKFKVFLRLLPNDYGRIIEEFLRTFRVEPYLSTTSVNPVQNRIVTNALNNEKNERTAAIANEIAAREEADAALQEQIDAVGDTYETKADAKAKANAWGVGMRYQATNTLKFFRPNL